MHRLCSLRKVAAVSFVYVLFFVDGAPVLAATTLTQTNATVTTPSPSNVTGGFNSLYSATSSTAVSGTGASADVRLTSSTTWATTTIESTGGVGLFSDIALDTNGKAHISHYDQTNGNLKYATNASGAWVTATVDSAGVVGSFTSIALGSDNKVHISYYNQTSGDLRYATNASGSWATTTVDAAGVVGRSTSIALDSNNKAHISYHDDTNGGIKYATNASGSWVTATVDTTGAGLYTSIDLDTSGKAHVSYNVFEGTYICGFDEELLEDLYCNDYALFYATNASGAWVTTSVDSADVVGESNSISLDSNGKAHIGYYDGTNGNLKYATSASGSWVTATVDSPGVVGVTTALALDTNDKAYISYSDETNGDLKYATNASGAWVTAIVDSAGTVGNYSSIAIATSSEARISYHDTSNSDLDYAAASLVYSTSGTYQSYVDGSVAAPTWSTLAITKGSTRSEAGSIRIQVKASSASTSVPVFGATGAACDFIVSSDGSSGSKDLTTCTGLGTGQYLWYKATLTTADTDASPLLQDVTISFIADSTAPTLTLVEPASTTIRPGATYTDPGATATDDVDGDITSDIVVTGSVNTAIADTYTLTYNVSDATGNAASSVSRTVIVKKKPSSSISSPAPSVGVSIPPQPAVTTSSPSNPVVFTRNAQAGMRGDDVRALQRYLNTHGFPITQKGPGASGQETVFFGPLTRAALIKFQKAHNITPAVGYFGPITRKILMSTP